MALSTSQMLQWLNDALAEIKLLNLLKDLCKNSVHIYIEIHFVGCLLSFYLEVTLLWTDLPGKANYFLMKPSDRLMMDPNYKTETRVF